MISSWIRLILLDKNHLSESNLFCELVDPGHKSALNDSFMNQTNSVFEINPLNRNFLMNQLIRFTKLLWMIHSWIKQFQQKEKVWSHMKVSKWWRLSFFLHVELRLRFPVPYLDKILNVNEAAASEAWLRKRRDDDLFSPLCMFATLHPGTLDLCYGPQIEHWPLCLIWHSLHRHTQL